jgi:hypothetical protein
MTHRLNGAFPVTFAILRAMGKVLLFLAIGLALGAGLVVGFSWGLGLCPGLAG